MRPGQKRQLPALVSKEPVFWQLKCLAALTVLRGEGAGLRGLRGSLRMPTCPGAIRGSETVWVPLGKHPLPLCLNVGWPGWNPAPWSQDSQPHSLGVCGQLTMSMGHLAHRRLFQGLSCKHGVAGRKRRGFLEEEP